MEKKPAVGVDAKIEEEMEARRARVTRTCYCRGFPELYHYCTVVPLDGTDA